MMTTTSSPLSAFFRPRGIAVIGASTHPGKLGHSVLSNLVTGGYEGAVYPINRHAMEILGRTCYARVQDVPDPVDLAVIIIPAPHVPAALEDCGQRGIRAVNILSGGFAESGEEGAALEAELLYIARRYQMRLIGPNCVGTIDVWGQMNATFIEQMPDPGAIAFFSQSGAVGGGMIDWAKGQHFGLSHFASLGNAIDIDECDMLEFLADDAHANVFTLYLEGLRDGRKLMQKAREITRRKPIVALKVGATEAGARAVASHTAHLAGTEAAFAAAFRQSGILQAQSTADLFGIALALAYQRPPAGMRVAILTNAGGPGAIAADALAKNGLAVPEPSSATKDLLREALGAAPQLSNPIDMLGAASSHEYEAAARVLLASPDYDAVLAILVPNAVNDPIGVADALARAQDETGKTLYACFMGDVSIRGARSHLHQHQIPAYSFPEDAARALRLAWQWQQWLTTELEPAPALVPLPPSVSQRLHEYLARQHLVLGESELYPLLEALDIAIPPYGLAHSRQEALSLAREMGVAVALKIHSPDILHKSDVGGVRLNLKNDEQVSCAYKELYEHIRTTRPQASVAGILVQAMAAPGSEVIVGMRRDPTFGPLLMFGGGGVLVEALKDVAFGIAPLSRREVSDMIERTVSGRLLAGYRQQAPADQEALIDLILKMTNLALAVAEIEQIELNPVIVHPRGQGVTVVDARAILRT